MAGNEPFDQLAGIPLDVYVAAVGTAIPAVDVDPTGAGFTLLGPTDGEQSLQHAGELTYFRDNDYLGARKAVRSEEDVIYTFTLVGLSIENYARVLDDVANVVSDAGPPQTKKVRLGRGAIPNEYALLAKGELLSPYGAFPAQYVIPRCVFDGEPEPTFAKDGRAALETEVHALIDDAQAAGDELGWLIAQET